MVVDPARGQDGLGEDEVVRRGELDVRPLPRDHRDAPAGVLDEGGVVGRSAQPLLWGGVDLAQQVQPEGLRGLDSSELRPVQRRQDRAVLGNLDRVGDRDRGDHAVRAAFRRSHYAAHQVGSYKAARSVVDQDDRLRVFAAQAQSAASGERPGLAGIGAARELLYARVVDQLLDAVSVADDVDPADQRAVFERLQSVVEGGPAAEVYKLLGAAHPAAGSPGEHERDGRAEPRDG